MNDVCKIAGESFFFFLNLVQVTACISGKHNKHLLLTKFFLHDQFSTSSIHLDITMALQQCF